MKSGIGRCSGFLILEMISDFRNTQLPTNKTYKIVNKIKKIRILVNNNLTACPNDELSTTYRDQMNAV